MDLSTFIVAVFCLVDDRLKDRESLRQRGPSPKLSDAEVLTIEIIGEFLGLDTDKGIYLFFKRHYAERFLTLGELYRTTFARHAANLCRLLYPGQECLGGRSTSRRPCGACQLTSESRFHRTAKLAFRHRAIS
jgi:hypothetical protein